MPTQAVEYRKGEAITHVTNTKLAAVMAAVGIPLKQEVPAVAKKCKDGNVLVTWCFEECTPDKSIYAKDVRDAWYAPDDFREKFPDHPITFAMDVLINYSTMVEHAKNPKTAKMVGYEHPNRRSVIWVVEGTEKERACLQRGLPRVDDIDNKEEI